MSFFFFLCRYLKGGKVTFEANHKVSDDLEIKR